jgi:DNA-binding PadR family transcriptional regulator
MGPKEQEILESALEAKGNGSTWSPGRGTSKSTLKRLVEEKGWLNRVDFGEFVITEHGSRALDERRDEMSGQQSIGDF